MQSGQGIYIGLIFIQICLQIKYVRDASILAINILRDLPDSLKEEVDRPKETNVSRVKPMKNKKKPSNLILKEDLKRKYNSGNHYFIPSI